MPSPVRRLKATLMIEMPVAIRGILLKAMLVLEMLVPI